MPEEQVTQLILEGLSGLRDDVKDLHKKIDTKFDLMNGRITKENSSIHDRTTVLTEIHIKSCADLESMKGRVNWLYVLVAGLFLTLAGAVFGMMTKGA